MPNILEKLYTDEERDKIVHNFEQGFLDNLGRFHNRKSAMEIAKRKGQIIREPYGEILYSENLW